MTKYHSALDNLKLVMNSGEGRIILGQSSAECRGGNDASSKLYVFIKVAKEDPVKQKLVKIRWKGPLHGPQSHVIKFS